MPTIIDLSVLDSEFILYTISEGIVGGSRGSGRRGVR